MTDQVLELLQDKHSDTAWHGALLTLAELAKNGRLQAHRLPTVGSVVAAALSLDIRRGAHRSTVCTSRRAFDLRGSRANSGPRVLQCGGARARCSSLRVLGVCEGLLRGRHGAGRLDAGPLPPHHCLLRQRGTLRIAARRHGTRHARLLTLPFLLRPGELPPSRGCCVPRERRPPRQLSPRHRDRDGGRFFQPRVPIPGDQQPGAIQPSLEKCLYDATHARSPSTCNLVASVSSRSRLIWRLHPTWQRLPSTLQLSGTICWRQSCATGSTA